jgi:hypothetical protein
MAEVCKNIEGGCLVEERQISCEKDVDAQGSQEIVLIADLRPRTGVVGGSIWLESEE